MGSRLMDRVPRQLPSCAKEDPGRYRQCPSNGYRQMRSVCPIKAVRRAI